MPNWIVEPNPTVKRVLAKLEKYGSLAGRLPTSPVKTGIASGIPLAVKSQVKKPNNLVEAFERRFGALNKAVGGGMTVTSGRRSTARQAALWRKALSKYGSAKAARKWVAPPGRSKHNIGLAKDIRFASKRIKALAHRLARKFGLTFPLSNEPWHIEPVEARK